MVAYSRTVRGVASRYGRTGRGVVDEQYRRPVPPSTPTPAADRWALGSGGSGAIQNLAQDGGECLGLAGHPEFAPGETRVPTREDDGLAV